MAVYDSSFGYDPVDETKPHYILWEPSSDLPPTRRLKTLEEAKRVAEVMARRHAGKAFHICHVIGLAKVAQAPVEVVLFKKGAK